MNNKFGKMKLKSFMITSLLMNVLLSSLLCYLIFWKTDLFDVFLARLGLSNYSSSYTRHQIEYRCLEGWANSLSKLHESCDVVFYGNSITFEGDFHNYFPDVKICNLGCNGDNLDDLIFRSFMIKYVNPSKIFILGGINHFNYISLNDFKKKYRIMVDSVRTQNPHAQIYLQSVLPFNSSMRLGIKYGGCQEKLKKANKFIFELSEEKKCVFIDLYSIYQENDSLPQRYTRDGVHLLPSAYTKWANILSSYIKK